MMPTQAFDFVLAREIDIAPLDAIQPGAFLAIGFVFCGPSSMDRSWTAYLRLTRA